MTNAVDRSVLVILILFAASGLNQISARGDAISTLHSTGNALPKGVVDPNFTIVSAPAGATLNPGGATDTIPPVATPAYVGAPAGSQWIGPNINNLLQEPSGNYDFQTTFSLAGLNPSTAKITGMLAADNGIADIKLNGVSLGISGGGFNGLLGYTMTSGFLPGKNTLDFIVNNNKSGGPTALMVSESGTASAIPEPSSLAVFGLAALALCVRQATISRARRAA